jgi:uncharacterized protein (DUF488 family)
VIYTIGHSTHAPTVFLDLLRAHRIVQLADVRTVPRSRRHPHFSQEALAELLGQQAIVYRHFPDLGGLRKPRSDSPNTAWRVPGFRGYADYMQTPAFRRGLEALLEFSGASDDFPASARTAVMCAEAAWWRCHRRLLADALVVRGIEVRHILSASEAKPHELSEFAKVVEEAVTYPGLL